MSASLSKLIIFSPARPGPLWRLARRFSDKCDEKDKIPPLRRSRLGVEDRVAEMLRNQSEKEGRMNVREEKESRPKYPFRMRKRSLSPAIRIQNLIDENDKK